MFKLPSSNDYFTRNTKVVIPKSDGGYYTGFIKVKFKYLSQKQLDNLIQQNSAEEYIEETSEEEQIDLLRNTVMYGFEGIEIGEKVLDDTDENDWDELLSTGNYSLYFRIAILNSFFSSITDIKGKLNRKGN